MIRLLIADDDLLVRAGLRMMIESQPDLEVVGEAGDGLEAVELTRRLRPDVVVMDIRMPRMDGIEATRIIATDATPTGGSAGDLDDDPTIEGPRVLVLTTFEIDEYVYEAVRAGASGFLLKRTPPEDLIAGIRVVAAGDALLAPSVTRRLMSAFARSSSETSRVAAIDNGDLGRLTDREREVLVLIASGLSNGEIAENLYVAESTVKTHVKRILMKLALRDRVHAVVYAYESGLVTKGRPPAG